MTDGVVVTVRLTPRSSGDRVEGPDADGVIHARVTAPPVAGAANRALVKLLAADLRVPKSSIEIVSGTSGRQKRLRITGHDASVVRKRWPSAAIISAPRS